MAEFSILNKSRSSRRLIDCKIPNDMPAQTQITTEVDYDRGGKQQGYLGVPYSHNEAGWANVLIPVTVLKNGRGPTLLAMAGNHGDEFEGPVALMKLARQLRPEDIRGRVIIIPALNLPAVLAGTRLSPIDGVNLNRAFPGKLNDTTTGLIAHYLSKFLFPLADIVMDIHSGGRSMNFIPCAHLHRVPDEDQFRKMLVAAKIWGSPCVFIYADIAGSGLLPAEAENMGKIVVTTEMGGAGQCSPEVLRITERGVRNVMIHFGLMGGEIDTPPADLPVFAATDRANYHLSPANGLYESFLEVGAEVDTGQPVGQVHFPETHDRVPAPVMARNSGVLICRRFPGNIKQGDCAAVIAQAVDL